MEQNNNTIVTALLGSEPDLANAKKSATFFSAVAMGLNIIEVSRFFSCIFFATFSAYCRLLAAFYTSHIHQLVLCSRIFLYGPWSTCSMAPTHIFQNTILSITSPLHPFERYVSSAHYPTYPWRCDEIRPSTLTAILRILYCIRMVRM